MEEKKQEHNFKFGIYIRNEKIIEKIFSADLYNPVVRYSVNIRDMIPSIIGDIQNLLQTKSEDLQFENEIWKNSLVFYKKMCDINNLDYFKLKVPNQVQKNNFINGKSYPSKSGTEFKFGLYINSNPIVERNFYVDNYNPESRFSIDIYELVCDIISRLEKYLIKSDVSQMWDDYKLIHTYDLNIQQVRELSREKREEYLKRTGDFNFIEKVRVIYNKQPDFVG